MIQESKTQLSSQIEITNAGFNEKLNAAKGEMTEKIQKMAQSSVTTNAASHPDHIDDQRVKELEEIVRSI